MRGSSSRPLMFGCGGVTDLLPASTPYIPSPHPTNHATEDRKTRRQLPVQAPERRATLSSEFGHTAGQQCFEVIHCPLSFLWLLVYFHFPSYSKLTRRYNIRTREGNSGGGQTNLQANWKGGRGLYWHDAHWLFILPQISSHSAGLNMWENSALTTARCESRLLM